MATVTASVDEMTGRTPASVITGLNFNQLAGAATKIVVAPDGSLWALSTQGLPTGDKFIYHYVNGAWTNIPGAAIRIAVAPNGTVYVVNAAGGIFYWNGTAWVAIAGGASDITVASDGSVYVISSVYGGPLGNGIWHYSNGSWSQLPGAAVRIVASWDTGTYANGISPGGFYVLNASQAIFYCSKAGTGCIQLPGAAYDLAPTTSGGLFALGVGGSPTARPIYYDDLSTGTWAQEPGAATSIAYDNGSLVVVGSTGGIYSSSVQVPTAQSTPPGVNITWTGFALSTSGGFTSVQSTIDVPQLTGSGSISFWPGLEPNSGAYVLQPVVQYVTTPYDNPQAINPTFAVAEECCTTNASGIISGTFGKTVSVQGGDTILTTMTLNGSTWTITLTNPRNSTTSTLTFNANGTPQQYLYFFIETHYNPGAGIPFLNSFSNMTFANTTVTSTQPLTTCNLSPAGDEILSQDSFSTPVTSNGGTTCSWATITVFQEPVPPATAGFYAGVDARAHFIPSGI